MTKRHNTRGRAGYRLKTQSGRDVGARAKPVWRCNGCGAWHEVKPVQCIDTECGRMDFQHFASKSEAKQFSELLLRKAAGEITDIVIQPSFELAVTPVAGGQPVIIGRANLDFSYTRLADGARVVVEVKGAADTDLSRWKRKHLEVQFGIVVEVISYG